MKGYNLNDNPKEIFKYKKYFFKEPMLLNINTNRLFWHSGAGIDDPKIFDRFKNEKNKIGKKAKILDKKIKKNIDAIWKKQLEKL
jgi:hypothetical protein